MDTVLEEGIWCTGCGWYEQEVPTGDRCMGCGCATGVHVPAKVVQAGEAL